MPKPIVQPPDAPLPVETPLWQFSTALWRNSRAADAALALQNLGWVVSHLLVAAYSAQQGRLWDGQEPEDIKAWRQQATTRLRQLRQSLPKGRDDLASLRQSLAQAELEAERIELGWWYRHLRQQPLPPTPPQGALELLAHNLSLAGELSGKTLELLTEFALGLIPEASRGAFVLELQARLDRAGGAK